MKSKKTFNKFHSLLEEYYNWLSRIKIAFTHDFANEFKAIRGQIKEGKLKKKELNSVIEANVSQEIILKEKEALH